MEKKRKKTVVIPDQPGKPDVPLVLFVGEGDDDERDVTKPIAFDQQGRPLYAPRGPVFRIPWPSR